MTPVTGPKRVPSADWVMAHFGASDCDPKSLADAKRETHAASLLPPLPPPAESERTAGYGDICRGTKRKR